jgi:hypothetical protein
MAKAGNSKNLTPKLGASLREYREAKGQKQWAVAYFLKRTKSCISMVEKTGYLPKKAHKGKPPLTEEDYRAVVDRLAGIRMLLLKLPKSLRAKRERKLLKEARKKFWEPLLYLVKRAIKDQKATFKTVRYKKG